MTPAEFASFLLNLHEHHRLESLTPSRCVHGVIQEELARLVAGSEGLLCMETAGTSLEGRTIHRVRFGDGPRRILLWTQMHGDEPTATLALLDVLHTLVHERASRWVRAVLREVTVTAIPLLNPDGAEHRRRHTVVGIDMNRDAERRATPEAQILHATHTQVQPQFAFNLHDQSVSSVGQTPRVAAIALLAPPFDPARSVNRVRLRAMRLGAFTARILSLFAEGHITRFDDTYEPRAFGDRLQAAGTSTLLVESGHWLNDPEKRFIRTLNYIALLSGFRAIGSGAFEDVELDHYLNLPPNGKQLFDIIIRGCELSHAGGWRQTVDIGLEVRRSMNGEAPRCILREVGDLSGFGGLETVTLARRTLPSEFARLDAEYLLADFCDALHIPPFLASLTC